MVSRVGIMWGFADGWRVLYVVRWGSEGMMAVI